MKYFKFLILSTSFVLCFSLTSCDPDENKSVNIYEDCCGNLPVNFDFEPGKIYIPNIFTPFNADGVNDIFFVLADDDIELIELLRISDKDGNVVFEEEKGLPNSIATGWGPDSSVPSGSYDVFVMVLNSEGNLFEAMGSLCVFSCDEDNPFEYTDKCGSPSQHSGNGSFDPFLPTFEEDCN